MRERYRMPSRMPQCVNSLPKMDKASRSLRSQTGRARSWCLRSGDKSRWSPKDFGNGLWDSKCTGISLAQLVPKLISKSQHFHHHVDFYRAWSWTSNILKDGKNGTPKYPNSLLLQRLEDLLQVLPLLNHQVGPQHVRELVGDTWSWYPWWGVLLRALHGWWWRMWCASCALNGSQHFRGNFRFNVFFTWVHLQCLSCCHCCRTSFFWAAILTRSCQCFGMLAWCCWCGCVVTHVGLGIAGIACMGYRLVSLWLSLRWTPDLLQRNGMLLRFPIALQGFGILWPDT